MAPLQLTWVDRAGNALGTVGEPGPYLNLALSRDERRIAVALSSGSPENRDIWLIDAARHDVLSRLTFDPGVDWLPVWSPDGSRIAFSGARAGSASLRLKVINGGMDEPLLQPGGAIQPTDWSADGRFIAFTSAGPSVTSDVWVLPMFGDRKPYAVVQTPFAETSAVFSPDGRWIAYTEGGASNVVVQRFPADGGKYQVSRTGGSLPIWRADGRELFYLAADGTMMAVPIEATSHFDPGVAQALFQTGVSRASVGRQYAVTKDGKRFLIMRTRQPADPSVLTVVVNWPASVQK
jgi:Tol biopolymer transport system component